MKRQAAGNRQRPGVVPLHAEGIPGNLHRTGKTGIEVDVVNIVHRQAGTFEDPLSHHLDSLAGIVIRTQGDTLFLRVGTAMQEDEPVLADAKLARIFHRG